MITSREIIVYGAMTLTDNDTFLVMVKNTVLLLLLQIMFLCFDVNV